MRLNYLYIPLLFLFSAGYATSQETKITSVEEADSIVVDSTSKIEILDFEIIKIESNKEEVSLLNKQLIAGQLDENKIVYSSKEFNKIIVQFLDNKDQIIEELVVKEPYLQIIDKYDATEQAGSYNDKVEKQKFSIHFNRNPNITSIKILKIGDKGTYEIYHKLLLP